MQTHPPAAGMVLSQRRGGSHGNPLLLPGHRSRPGSRAVPAPLPSPLSIPAPDPAWGSYPKNPSTKRHRSRETASPELPLARRTSTLNLALNFAPETLKRKEFESPPTISEGSASAKRWRWARGGTMLSRHPRCGSQRDAGGTDPDQTDPRAGPSAARQEPDPPAAATPGPCSQSSRHEGAACGRELQTPTGRAAPEENAARGQRLGTAKPIPEEMLALPAPRREQTPQAHHAGVENPFKFKQSFFCSKERDAFLSQQRNSSPPILAFSPGKARARSQAALASAPHLCCTPRLHSRAVLARALGSDADSPDLKGHFEVSFPFSSWEKKSPRFPGQARRLSHSFFPD